MAPMKPNYPLISIVVPSYNQGRFLPETLDSIFRQEYPRLEVIVIDGGSTDDSVDVIRRYAHRLKYWQSEKDDGQSAAINTGMRHCSGDLVAWLNSDDYYWGDCLWTIARAWNAHPHRGMYIGNGRRFDEATGLDTPFNMRHIAFQREALKTWVGYILQPSVFFLRDAWEAVGGLNESLHYCMDWDILIRISQRYPVTLINEFIAVNRDYPEAKTQSGMFPRALEILQNIQQHTGTAMTVGGLAFWLEPVLRLPKGTLPDETYEYLERGLSLMTDKLFDGHRFPDTSDPQDVTYLPIPRYGEPEPETTGFAFEKVLGSIRNVASQRVSIVVPSLNSLRDVKETVLSISRQKGANLQCLVMDGGSRDGTIEWLKSQNYEMLVWDSQPDSGPAAAINRGMSRADGEIVAWLKPGDRLTAGAAAEAARAFQSDDRVDLVHGNAVFYDETDRPVLVPQDGLPTAFWQTKWSTAAGPSNPQMFDRRCLQPTLFMRRSFFDHVGELDESLRYIYDLDWRLRWPNAVEAKKIERTQAVMRMIGEINPIYDNAFRDEMCEWMLRRWGPEQDSHRVEFHFANFHQLADFDIRCPAATPESWNAVLRQGYHRRRNRWPKLFSSEFIAYWRRYVGTLLARKFPDETHGIRHRLRKMRVALATLFHIGNPEAWWPDQRGTEVAAAPQLSNVVGEYRLRKAA